MNRPTCFDSAMAEALLGLAPRRERSFSSEQRAHLEACEGCRIAVERIRRLSKVWRALEPSPAELGAASARFELRRTRQGVGRRVTPGGFAFAVVVLAAAAAAARVEFVSSHFWVRGPVTGDGPAEGSIGSRRPAAGLPAKQSAKPPAVPPMPPSPAIDPVVPHGEAAPPRAVQPDLFPRATARSPIEGAPIGGGGFHRDGPTPSAPQSGPSSAQESTARSDVALPSALPSTQGTPALPGRTSISAWPEAAAAMRDGDYARAERAFDELIASGDAHTRDAARLARAQMWLSQGRASETRAELESLATEGATPFVRARAAEALGGLH